MGRLYLAGAALGAVLVAFVAGTIWFSHETALARAQGLAAGRAEMTVALEAETARQRAAAEAALAQTNARIAALEQARDEIQETYDALVATTNRDPDAGRICLGPGLVRALAAIGRDGAAARPRP